jgi:drug/metabolite transporter (DMT)-like permease
MILRHLIAVLIIIVFEAVAFWYFLDKPIARQVLAGIFTIVYGLILYSYSRKLAALDNKPYTPLKPDIKWGVLWGLAISATVAVMLVLYKFNWHHFSAVSEDGTPYITNIAAIIVNLLFYIWTGPYFGFIDNSGGGIAVYAQILMIIVPIAATTVGYVAGVKNFDLVEKLDSMTLEKNEDDDDDEE